MSSFFFSKVIINIKTIAPSITALADELSQTQAALKALQDRFDQMTEKNFKMNKLQRQNKTMNS